jgi:hypothetical protein
MIGSFNKNRVRRERHPHNVRLLNKLSRHTGSEESIIRRHTLMEETKLELTQHPLNPTTHPASLTVNTTSILHGRIRGLETRPKLLQYTLDFPLLMPRSHAPLLIASLTANKSP